MNTEARSTAGPLVQLEKGVPLKSPSVNLKSSLGKGGGVVKRKQR